MSPSPTKKFPNVIEALKRNPKITTVLLQQVLLANNQLISGGTAVIYKMAGEKGKIFLGPQERLGDGTLRIQHIDAVFELAINGASLHKTF